MPHQQQLVRGGELMFHKHQWAEIARTYAAPVQGVEGRMSNDAFARLVMGVTTLALRCSVDGCGKLRKLECLGKEVAP